MATKRTITAVAKQLVYCYGNAAREMYGQQLLNTAFEWLDWIDHPGGDALHLDDMPELEAAIGRQVDRVQRFLRV